MANMSMLTMLRECCDALGADGCRMVGVFGRGRVGGALDALDGLEDLEVLASAAPDPHHCRYRFALGALKAARSSGAPHSRSAVTGGHVPA